LAWLNRYCHRAALLVSRTCQLWLTWVIVWMFSLHTYKENCA
jgi:hypothetical protein